MPPTSRSLLISTESSAMTTEYSSSASDNPWPASSRLRKSSRCSGIETGIWAVILISSGSVTARSQSPLWRNWACSKSKKGLT